MRKVFRGYTPVLVLFAVALCVAGRPALAQEVQVYRDIPYYDGPGFYGPRHILDVYVPEGAENYPVLMFIHGGSWTAGNKNSFGFLGNAFARYGFVTVIANYRLTDGSPGRVTHPGHVQDVARAFAWTYAYAAAFGGDPEKIFISGHSAGGHLVALLALDPRYLLEHGLLPDMIKGVIGISGVYDVRLPIPTFTVPFGGSAETRADASPALHVGDYPAPPMQLLYGANNYPTLDVMAIQLYQALLGQGSEAYLQVFPGRTHTGMVTGLANPGDPVAEAMLTFLFWRLYGGPYGGFH